MCADWFVLNLPERIHLGPIITRNTVAVVRTIAVNVARHLITCTIRLTKIIVVLIDWNM